jgi:capsid protein
MVAIAARYDAAQTTPDNARHWSMADGLSPSQSNNSGIRWLLRNRSRYEYSNNSFLSGMASTLAIDTIGKGPRLQLSTMDGEGNQHCENAWMKWSRRVKLAKKLRLARMTKMVDGEVFLVMFTDHKLPGPIKLNFEVRGAEHFFRDGGYELADGIEYDSSGNVVRYWTTKKHPSEGGRPTPINARWVIHYQSERRPGESRSVPETVPSLPLFACLRRFTLATIAAAETAADFAAVLKSMMPPEDGTDQIAAFTELEIVQRMMVALPRGVELQQLKAEHPATTYEMFRRVLMEEIARTFNMPYNIAVGNSGGYNYASGRLDVQVYFRSVCVERDLIETEILQRLWEAWAEEAVLVPDLLPEDPTPYGDWEIKWYWGGWGHVDPVKEAAAQERRLKNHTTTLQDEWAREGEDWERKVAQRAREIKRLKELGLTDADVAPARIRAEQRQRPRQRQRRQPSELATR